MECVTRLIPGVLGNEESSQQESFAPPSSSNGAAVLDCPHYTRPAEFEGLRVPEILLSGNHEEIRRWRRRQALEKTWRIRPDLLTGAALDDQDRRVLQDIQQIERLGD